MGTVTLRNRLVPLLVIACLVLDIISPYRGWRILYVGLGGAWLLSFLWARSLARHVRFTRAMRFGWAQVGDRLVERFTVSNNGWASAPWLEIEDRSTLPGYRAGRSTAIRAYDTIRWHTEAVCRRRGLFILGPTRLHLGTPFGIYEVTLDYPATRPLLVLPPIVPLPAIEIAPGGRSGDAPPRAYAPDITVSAATVREYLPGDSRRWIHWRTTARKGRLYVRNFDSTPAGDWWILLDMDRHVQAGTGMDATQEHGVILAASLADRGLRERRAVGLVVHGDKLIWLPPRSGEGHRWEILRALAMIELGDRPLVELLERVRPSLGHRASLILITPSVATAWIEAIIPLIRRGTRVTVLLLDPTTFGGRLKPDLAEAALAELGVRHYRITREMLDRPELQPGRRGQWEWRVLGTGRVVPTHRPRETAWRLLT